MKLRVTLLLSALVWLDSPGPSWGVSWPEATPANVPSPELAAEGLGEARDGGPQDSLLLQGGARVLEASLEPDLGEPWFVNRSDVPMSRIKMREYPSVWNEEYWHLLKPELERRAPTAVSRPGRTRGRPRCLDQLLLPQEAPLRSRKPDAMERLGRRSGGLECPRRPSPLYSLVGNGPHAALGCEFTGVCRPQDHRRDDL